VQASDFLLGLVARRFGLRAQRSERLRGLLARICVGLTGLGRLGQGALSFCESCLESREFVAQAQELCAFLVRGFAGVMGVSGFERSKLFA
jgi:hypothetical protein